MSSATGKEKPNKEKPASQKGVGGEINNSTSSNTSTTGLGSEGGSSSFGYGLNLFCGMLAATLALSL